MTVLQNERNMGKRLGIKNAVLKTHTDLIMSVDSDVIVDSGALRTLVRHMYAADVDAAGGCVFVSNADENWLTRMQAVKYWIGYQFLKNVENAFSHIMCLSGCLTLYKRAALLAVDHDVEKRTFLGDDVKYGEDRFLTRKLVERGYKTRLCFQAQCYTKAPATISKLSEPAAALATIKPHRLHNGHSLPWPFSSVCAGALHVDGAVADLLSAYPGLAGGPAWLHDPHDRARLARVDLCAGL